MDDEHVPVCTVKPGEDHDAIAGLDALKPVEHVWLELDPGVGSALVALPGSGVRIGQRRLDATYQPELVGQGYGRVSQSISGWA